MQNNISGINISFDTVFILNVDPFDGAKPRFWGQGEEALLRANFYTLGNKSLSLFHFSLFSFDNYLRGWDKLFYKAERLRMHPLQEKIYQTMTPEQKLRIAIQLYSSARHLKMAALRHAHPDWTEKELKEKVGEFFL